MAYSINPASLGSMFAVPSDVADNYIKFASASQLKTLLWVFRHASEPIDPERISADIGYKPSDVEDALITLCQWNVLTSDGVKTEPMPKPQAVTTPAPEQKAEQKKELEQLQAVKPTPDQVSVRCKEDTQIRSMFTDIASMLGRTLGYDSQAILIMMHDHYGLPVEVIYMLIDYCNSIGKRGFSYISKVGKDWGEREVDTIEKADEQIRILRSCTSLWKEFAKMAGLQNPLPTETQSAYLRKWSQDFKYQAEMIYLAYEETVSRTGKVSFNYMNKILANWNNDGIRTPDDIEKAKLNYQKTNAQKKTNGAKTSFGINEFSQRADKLPVYKKEG